MPIAINGSGTVTGISAGGLPDGCIIDADINGVAASKLSGALPAISGASLTNVPINTDFALWRVTTGWSGNTDPIQNFAENNHSADMSHSSGIFSFPTTGFWKIMFQTYCYYNADQDNIELHLMRTVNGGSSYNIKATSYSHMNNDDGGNLYTTLQVSHIFDVTDTSNCKVKFKTAGTSANFHATSSSNESYAIFQRLGDT